jgi:hypothetical protein
MAMAYQAAERKLMHARLRALTGRWLLTPDAVELERLAETLSVPLRWRRHKFQGDKCVAFGQPATSSPAPKGGSRDATSH